MQFSITKFTKRGGFVKKVLRVVKFFAAYAVIAVFSCTGLADNGAGKRGLEVLPDTDTSVAVYSALGHADGVLAAAYSPNGRFVVSASRDYTLKIWDTGKGRELYTLTGHTGEVHAAVFSPDGAHIVSGSDDTTVKIWDVQTGREIASLGGHDGSVVSLNFSKDGKYLLSCAKNKIIIWNITAKKEIRSFAGNNLTSAAFSPDGKNIVSGGSDSLVTVRNAKTGKEARILKGHGADITSVAYSPDGKFILSASGDKTLKLWNAADGKEIRTFSGHKNWVSSAAFGPDGKYIVSGGSDETIMLWETATGRILHTIQGHTNTVSTVAFAPGGEYIVSGSLDRSIKVWDTASGREYNTLSGYGGGVGNVSFSPDGKYIACGSGRRIEMWEAATGKHIRSFSGSAMMTSLAYSPDGKRIAAGMRNSTLAVWDVETGEALLNITGHNKVVNSVAFSPDNKYIVSGSGDLTIRLWDAATGREEGVYLGGGIFKGHTDDVQSVAFSHDGNRIVSAADDQTIRIWETGNYAHADLVIHTGHNMAVDSAVFSPDGKFIVSASNKIIKIWDVQTGQEIRTIEGHTARIHSVAFSPDGKRIISASNDNTVRVWDAESGGEIVVFSGHRGSVYSAVFDDDGSRAISGSQDGTVRILDTAPETKNILEIASFISFTGTDTGLVSAARGLTVEMEISTASVGGEWLSITPDGFYQASPRGDRYLNVRVGDTVSGIDAYGDIFYNPEVVEARLRGLPDPAAKSKVTIQQAGSFRPPTVTIQEPRNGAIISDGDTVNLSVNVTDQKQNVKEIRILVNGIRIGSGELSSVTGTQGITVEDGGFSVSGDQKNVQFAVPVTLVEPGINRIEVMAFNGYSWGYSGDTYSVDVTWQPAAGRKIPLPNLWILAVGINRYDNSGKDALRLTGYKPLSSLNFCANDARELITAFKVQEGKRYGKVNSLLIADGEIVEPTADNIRNNLKFLDQAGQRDVVLLFLAGHGLSEGNRFYFLAKDAAIINGEKVDPTRAISDETLKTVLNAPGRRLIFIDACQSGGMDIDRFMHSLKRTNAFMLSSSEGTMPSYEDAPNMILWNRHGAFSYSIIRGLNGLAAPSRGAGIGVLQLSGYVRKEVPDLTRQYPLPQKPVQYSWGFGDFDIAW
jgi:WD40 repeat protein